ncbi:hypothetical protein [Lignipirellula cremea]|uniref:Uncharacterized protein n=1 Tax=Lignipirellula cremea TaxID=2528010 RepID=A0A518E2V3_9BACT|nr:hypothetical protein [Lignipirellula cremea]QDU98417.1 hypothetical protein Pla8534_62850 [Lignipirellula cremea]
MTDNPYQSPAAPPTSTWRLCQWRLYAWLALPCLVSLLTYVAGYARAYQQGRLVKWNKTWHTEASQELLVLAVTLALLIAAIGSTHAKASDKLFNVALSLAVAYTIHLLLFVSWLTMTQA